MRKGTEVLLAVVTLILATPSARPTPKPAEGDDQGRIVIIFKDGHQQSFRVADVARIEFNQPTRSTSAVSSARFQGRWKVGDGAGGTFYITLKPEGQAEKTLGSPNGTWTATPTTLVVTPEATPDAGTQATQSFDYCRQGAYLTVHNTASDMFIRYVRQ